MFNIPLNVNTPRPIPLSVAGDEPIRLTTSITIQPDTTPDYDGEYEATPSSKQQTFNVEGMRMTRDFVVNPIPSNYGLITWNGSFLTVS